MPEPPQRDWTLYTARRQAAHRDWLRSLAPESGFALFEELYRFAASLPCDPQESDRLERLRWRHKLEARRKVVAALVALDHLQRGERGPNNAG